MLKKAKKVKKSAKKATKRVRKPPKVTVSGARHLEGLARAGKKHEKSVYDIFSAVRGPDMEDYHDHKGKYTGVIRTWIFGANQCGGMVTSLNAPVTAKGWEELDAMALKEPDVMGNHFLGHIRTACEAIGRLYKNGTFKEGT